MTDYEQKIENQKILAEIENLNAATRKFVREHEYLRIQMLVSPFLAAAGVIGATAAVVKLFFP